MERGVFILGPVVDEVVRHVRAGTSVNLVGLRSSGRTAVLGHVAEALPDFGLAPLRLTGVAALRDRPLATLALSGIELTSTSLTPGGLGQAARALERALSARPSVVVVDDADEVDAMSAGLLVGVRATLPVPVVAASRPAGRRQPAAHPLTAELRPAVRVDLEPLGYADVLRLVHRLLPGPVDRSTTARIATTTGGLPGLVTALVGSMERTGVLAQRGGTWIAAGDTWTAGLVQAVEPLIGGLDDGDLEALTALALSGTVTLHRATQLASWESVARLEDCGLLHVSPAGSEPVVGVFPPLLARYLAHDTSLVRAVRLRDQVAPLYGLRPIEPDGLRPAPGGLPGRGSLPVLDRQYTEFWRAEVTVRHEAWSRNPVPATAVPLVLALHGVDAPARDVDEVLGRTRADASDARATARLAGLHVLDVALLRRDIAGAERLLDSSPTPTGYTGLLCALRAHISLVTETPLAMSAVVAADDDGPLAREAVAAVRIECALASGDTRAAAAEIDGFSPIDPRFVLARDLSTAIIALVDGRVSDGTALALSFLEDAREQLDAGGVRAHAYVAALGLYLRGRLDDADALLSQTLALTSRDGLAMQYQDGVLVLAALVASLRGDSARARALAAQAESLGAPRGPFPAMYADVASALVRGPGEDTGRLLWDLAEERLTHGFPFAAAAAAVAAMERFADPARGRRIIAELTRVDSRLVRALCAYLEAIGLDDDTALAHVQERLRDEGLDLYATRAALSRAIALRERGDLPGSVEQARLAWADAESRGSQTRGLFAALVHEIDLSVRERQIIARISEGVPSSAVASAMGLSVRTVDNHVQNSMRKVGVDSREALIEAVDTWAALPST